MNTIIVKVNDASQTIAEHTVVTQDGKPTVIKAVNNVNYELINQQTGRAPNHIVTKRVGNNLHVSMEDEGQDSDLIIEDFYGDDDSALIGLAEDGHYYYYIPDTGEIADYVTELAAGDIEGQALGGQSQVAPWWVGATETEGFGILPWLVGLAGVGAAIALLDDDDESPYVPEPAMIPLSIAANFSGEEVTGKVTDSTGNIIADSVIVITITDINGNKATITTTTDANGNYRIPQTGTGDGDQNYTIGDGDVLTIIASKAGYVEDDAEILVVKPVVNEAGAQVTGKAPAGSTVTLDVDNDGIVDLTTIADVEGNYTFDTSAKPIIGEAEVDVVTPNKIVGAGEIIIPDT